LHSSVATAEADGATSTATEEEDLYKKLGVAEDKLALGITPDEVLEFIGTREDLINKFQADIPRLSRSEAETEVDKFFLDGEMLDLYIKYAQRKKEDPNWEPVYAEDVDDGPFGMFMRIVGTYAIWIVGGLLVKDVVTGYLSKNGGDGGGEEVAAAVAMVVEGAHQHLMV